MPKHTPSDEFQPIEVQIGEQTPPAVSEVDFTPAPPAIEKPHPAAPKKED
ncbi:hypothetical protein ACPPVT_07495 [Angustibacter sp. McL0619]